MQTKKTEVRNIVWIIIGLFLMLLAGCGYVDDVKIDTISKTQDADITQFSRQSLRSGVSLHVIENLLRLSKDFKTVVQTFGDVNVFKTLILLSEASMQENVLVIVLMNDFEEETGIQTLLVESRFPETDPRLSLLESFVIQTQLTKDRSDDQLIDYLGFVSYRDHSTETIQVEDLDLLENPDAQLDLTRGSVRKTSLRAFTNDDDRVSLWEMTDILIHEPEAKNLIIQTQQRITAKDGTLRSSKVNPEKPITGGSVIERGNVLKETFFPPHERRIRSLVQNTLFSGVSQGKLRQDVYFSDETVHTTHVDFTSDGYRKIQEFRPDGTVVNGEISNDTFWLLTEFPERHRPISALYEGSLSPLGGDLQETIVFSSSERFVKEMIFEAQLDEIRIAVEDSNGTQGFFVAKGKPGEMAIQGCLIAFENPEGVTVSPEGFFYQGNTIQCLPPIDKGLPIPGILSQTWISQSFNEDRIPTAKVIFTPFQLPKENRQELNVRFEPDGSGYGTVAQNNRDFVIEILPNRSGKMTDVDQGAVAFFVY